MNGERRGFHRGESTPDLRNQLFFLNGSIFVPAQVRQQIKFPERQGNRLPVSGHGSGGQIHPDAAEGDHSFLLGKAVGAAYQGIDSRQQLLHGIGLGQVVISPDIETRDPVGFAGSGAGKNHRGGGSSAQLLANLESISIGQIDVQQYDVVSIALQKVKSLFAVFGTGHLIPIPLQHIGNDKGQILVIVNDENFVVNIADHRFTA